MGPIIFILVAWPGIGALLGYLASRRGGFSRWIGYLGGAALGPFAVLLFEIKDANYIRCPHCQEWRPPAATVCPHCGRDIPSA